MARRKGDDDPIIDKSPEQKRIRVLQLRTELALMGYSVVRSKWLQQVLDKLAAIEE